MCADRARRASGFDRLAAIYRPLEWLAFGDELQRARSRYLHRLRGCREILVLGEGDGRCLEQLVRAAPEARIRCIDRSRAMLERAMRRLDRGAGSARVQFEQADAEQRSYAGERYDAVITFFFLDCFTAERVGALVARLRPALRPGALWLFADFAMPPSGWARLRARGWLAVLYAFFRWQTGIEAAGLPPSETILERAHLTRVAEDVRQGGFIRTTVFEAG